MRVSEPVEEGKEGRGGIYRVGMSWSSDSLEPGGGGGRGGNAWNRKSDAFSKFESEKSKPKSSPNFSTQLSRVR